MSTGSSNRSPTVYTGNNQAICTIASRNREPSGTDLRHPNTGKYYPIGFLWIISANPVSGVEGDLWYLTRITANVSYWQLIAESGDSQTITGDTGPALPPTAGNWEIIGQTSGVLSIPSMQTNGSGSSLTIEDRTSTSAFVVGGPNTAGNRGTYITIQDAVSNASSGDTVFIKSGTYTENVTLKDGVNLAAYGNSGFTPTVTIKGKLTFADEGFCTLSGLALQSNGDYALSVTGSSVSRIYLIECNVIAEDFAAIQLTTTGVGSSIRLVNCWCRTNAVATNFFVATGVGGLTFWNVNVIDGGATAQSTPSTFASSGQLLVKYSIIRFPITLSGTGRISGTASEFNTFATNSIPLVVNAISGAALGHYVRGCIFLSGNTTALTVGAGVTLNMEGNSVITTGAVPFTGTGTINQSGTSYSSTNPVPSNTTVTLARKAFDPGALWGNWSGVAPASGYVGQVISSFIRDTSAVTITNSGDIVDVTTIVLTPGIWDVSGMVMFTGLTTTTRQNGSIGTSSAAIPNISYGDNTASATFATTTGDDVSVTIPIKRQLVTSGTTTMYLIARATWSVATTAKAYGKITAVRVV